ATWPHARRGRRRTREPLGPAPHRADAASLPRGGGDDRADRSRDDAAPTGRRARPRDRWGSLLRDAGEGGRIRRRGGISPTQLVGPRDRVAARGSRGEPARRGGGPF